MTGTLQTGAQALEAVADEVVGCTACQLSQSRTRAVPGDGPADARVMFIGEGPGYHEDRQGLPFVGAAGNLLNELLEGIGLHRSEVFITNIVKCRPPGNRDPEQPEIEACRRYLLRQIEAIDPPVIVTLGRFALEHFMPGARISRVHGQARRVGGRLFVPVLHPAAALHRASWRPQLEQDFQALKSALRDEEAARDAGTAVSASAQRTEPPAQQLDLFQ